LCQPKGNTTEYTTTLRRARENVEDAKGRDVLCVLLKVLSKLDVEAQKGGDGEAEYLFDGLRHLVYAKRTPPILAEAEQKIVNMLRILYPSLQKGILSHPYHPT